MPEKSTKIDQKKIDSIASASGFSKEYVEKLLTGNDKRNLYSDLRRVKELSDLYDMVIRAKDRQDG